MTNPTKAEKRVFMTPSVREFEQFVNRDDIEVISIDVKTVEQNCNFQEGFAGLVFYKTLTPNK